MDIYISNAVHNICCSLLRVMFKFFYAKLDIQLTPVSLRDWLLYFSHKEW